MSNHVYKPSCRHNDAVICVYKQKPCSTCGWNPEVAKARMKKFLSSTGGRKTTSK